MKSMNLQERLQASILLVEETAKKYNDKLQPTFIGNLAAMLATKNPHDAKYVMNKLPRIFKRFPTSAEIEQLIDTRTQRFIRQQQEVDWRSKKAPGMPASIECLCRHIKKGTTDDRRFKAGMRITGLTNEEMWKIYEAWCAGKVHELARKRRDSVVIRRLRDVG